MQISLPDITHRTQPITLSLSGNHVEKTSMFLFNAPSATLVPGFPWLNTHNPNIDWFKCCIPRWSLWCYKNCLPSVFCSQLSLFLLSRLIQLLSPQCIMTQQKCLVRIQPSLSPHCPYHCGIDLLPRFFGGFFEKNEVAPFMHRLLRLNKITMKNKSSPL